MWNETENTDVRLIFTYGTLRSSEYNFARANGWIRGEQLKVVGQGALRGFDLHTLGPYPAITPGQGTVTGELMTCPLKLFDYIDRMERGAGYTAQQVEVVLEDGRTMPAVAWVYEFPDELTEKTLIKSGDWLKR